MKKNKFTEDIRCTGLDRHRSLSSGSDDLQYTLSTSELWFCKIGGLALRCKFDCLRGIRSRWHDFWCIYAGSWRQFYFNSSLSLLQLFTSSSILLYLVKFMIFLYVGGPKILFLKGGTLKIHDFGRVKNQSWLPNQEMPAMATESRDDASCGNEIEGTNAVCAW